jgi:hypothetical protein
MSWLFWTVGVIIFIFGVVVFRGAPYVPSHRRQVERALDELYRLQHKDLLIDVGSGDGVVLRQAAKRGARAIGYELNPILVIISRWLSRKDKKVSVHLADFWNVALPGDTTVVYGFLVTRDIDKMARKLQHEANRLGRQIHFISYGAKIKDRPAIRQIGAHHLYLFSPLQMKQP